MSQSPTLSNQFKLYKIDAPLKESPVANLRGDHVYGGEVNFFIDTGADINVIKETALKGNASVSTENTSHITGITTDKLYTLGTLEIEILNKKHPFHVVEESFLIEAQGILGRPFLREERSNLNFFYNILITSSRPTEPIPFIDPESKQAKIDLAKEVKPVPRITYPKPNQPSPKAKSEIKIQHKILRIIARSRQVVEIPVLKTDLKEGYLPKIETQKGVFLGEALVT